MVRDLQRQDTTAFRRLVQRFTGLVCRQIRLSLGQDAPVEDLAQEVFWNVYQALPRFTGTHLAAWIAQIARHRCIDEIRARSRRVRTVDEEAGRAAPAVEAEESLGEVPDVLRGLSPIERQVMMLRIIDRMSYAEIATATGRSEGSLRNMVSLVLQRIRKEVTGHDM
ncbi:MAG: sigma-70 family RNA polymerase sigma factor [Candidatus Riflebacteria bacterium]|nr:sigma-70 family RNA polymerase sigma factor [Candidatus Riflebacteria bacterium]